MEVKEKQRIIQEFVPGKQITLAHVIAGPDPAIYVKLEEHLGFAKAPVTRT